VSPVKSVLLVISSVFLIFGISLFARVIRIHESAAPIIQNASPLTQSDSAIAPETPIKMDFAPDNTLPYLITADGALLQPTENAVWRQIALDAHVNDIYFDVKSCAIAATDEGIYTFSGGNWQRVNDTLAGKEVVSMHGFTFALGDLGIMREGHGEWRQLELPIADQPASGFVMLGNHNHVLLNGDLFITPDMGLGWQLLESPDTVDLIWADVEGNLLAVTADALIKWDRLSLEWRTLAPLPQDYAIDDLRVFQRRIYALANGGLYLLENGAWMRVELEARITAIEVHPQETLWALDGENAMLWTTEEGTVWHPTAIAVGDETGQMPECQMTTSG